MSKMILYSINKTIRVLKGLFRFAIACLVVSGYYWFFSCLPEKLFNDPTSTVLLDRSGQLLGAKIAGDGQWRFHAGKNIPGKFEVCLLQFEDRDFYSHFGISPKGIGRAIVQNIKNKKVVSGGSTITMQLARIMRKNPPRTLDEKVVEILLASRLEIKYTKSEILEFYAGNAPFGNNVVGLEAASWRYFGRSADKLSWAESATLAVLPNAPGLIYPGKNKKRLLEKRNRLLKRLYEIKIIDESTYQLALSEPLPEKPLALPQLAPHLLSRFIKEGQKGKTIQSTLDIHLQEKAAEILENNSQFLRENKIFNGAIIITSVKSSEVLAYIGNTNLEEDEYGCDVDCANAPRSTGSILKPFLFAKSLEDGKITPTMLLQDIPSQFGSFSPKNFNFQYDGAVPANKALARSLNIPMVRLLNEYGLEKFHRELKNMGISTLNHPARHYGLSLILGGAEATLWDLNKAYTQMARELNYKRKSEIHMTMSGANKNKHSQYTTTNRACIYSTFEAMVDVNRPDEYGNWRSFTSAQKIAWKTGTSFGFRDAWAIGITPDYVVSVWIGNGDGEGRPGLTGIKAAAPVLFDVFSQLPHYNKWFTSPGELMNRVAICRESGHRATELCDKTDTSWIPATCLNSVACPYHQIIHLNKKGTYRVDSECENVYNMHHVPWFVLPPMVEKYYKCNHPNYKLLPEYKPECLSKIADKALYIQYPRANSKIYVPVEIDEQTGRTIFEATHRNTQIKVYWHLDDNYLGETKEIHQMSLNPAPGLHKLTLVDENGVTAVVNFEVMGK